jgi:flagella basal body P-ring formation protein FlgA
MANRLIKSLILLLYSSCCLSSSDSYIERELLKKYVKVEINSLNSEIEPPCSGEVVNRDVQINLNARRLLYSEDCKVENQIFIQRHWYAFRGFNYGFVLTASLKKGQIIKQGQYENALVEDFGSLMLNKNGQKTLLDLSVGTVLLSTNTTSNKAALIGDEMDVLINYRSARVTAVGIVLENALPGEFMKIRVNGKVLNSTLTTLGVAHVD